MSAETPAFEPGYIALYKSGELRQRAKALESRLASCNICPRECGANRLEGETGHCHSAYKPIVTTVTAHHGEEPVLSGTRGSGTIFLGNCNMRCVFCQNFQISQDHKNQKRNEIEISKLAEYMLYLQDELGCHNINFVSPTHFVPQIVRALLEAVPMGLRLPLVYNTGGYDSIETLRELEGIIDIYLPDLKYASAKMGEKYSGAKEYPSHARAAIKEMYRQVGNLITDEYGIAMRGVIVRHLVLPNRIAGSKESLTWLAKEVSPEVTVNVMSQYHPANLAHEYPELSRRITKSEYGEVVETVYKLGIENGWLQGLDSPEIYLPDFNRKSGPFEPE
jgi:putative pyruvate formate lyase activating enzyme